MNILNLHKRPPQLTLLFENVESNQDLDFDNVNS